MIAVTAVIAVMAVQGVDRAREEAGRRHPASRVRIDDRLEPALTTGHHAIRLLVRDPISRAHLSDHARTTLKSHR
jgi:hypothetical protein